MQKLHKQFSTVETPQTEPIPGDNQVENSAGGFSYAVDDWKRLDRFLILGTEGGSYYASERDLTKENCDGIVKCIKADGLKVVNRVVEISDSGRAPKNDPALFVLAMCTSPEFANQATRRAAFEALPKVARIGTHLFHFAQYVQAFRGWGKGLKKAIQKWYLDKDTDTCAYLMVKYQQRDGWSHRDLLRLSHPKTKDVQRNALFSWSVQRGKSEQKDPSSLPKIVQVYEELWANKTDEQRACRLITDHKLPREVVPTELLASHKVWEALLQNMPLEAMIRNLATMTKVGLLKPLSDAVKLVVSRLGSEEQLKKSRIHPIKVLAALKTYEAGHGQRSDAVWELVTQIVDALDEAFYLCFKNVEPSNKNILIGLDVSSSMEGGEVAGVIGLTPRIASAALCLVTARTEPNYTIMAFSDELVPVTISPGTRLDDIVQGLNDLPFGGTDCALPMIYASAEKLKVDGFVVYTDSDTWAGDIHPTQALSKYRNKFVPSSKLVVVGMTSNGFSIADPKDAGMLDVVGFDTATPAIISDFIRS